MTIEMEMLMIRIDNIVKRLDKLEQMVDGVSKRIDALEAKMKFTFVPEQQTTTQTATFTTRTDAIEDFVQNFPNATTGQVYRIIW